MVSADYVVSFLIFCHVLRGLLYERDVQQRIKNQPNLQTVKEEENIG